MTSVPIPDIGNCGCVASAYGIVSLRDYGDNGEPNIHDCYMCEACRAGAEDGGYVIHDDDEAEAWLTDGIWPGDELAVDE